MSSPCRDFTCLPGALHCPFHAPPALCRLATSGIIDRIEAALSVYGRGETLAAERAEVAEWQTRYVQGVVFERTCGFNSHPRHHKTGACSSVGLERSPAEAKAVGSSPTRRTSGRLAQRFRASVLHTEGRRFKSCTAHHQNPQKLLPDGCAPAGPVEVDILNDGNVGFPTATGS